MVLFMLTPAYSLVNCVYAAKMERSGSDEDLQIQDPETHDEENAHPDYSQLNRHKSCAEDEGLGRETEIIAMIERPAGKPFVPTRDFILTTQMETDADSLLTAESDSNHATLQDLDRIARRRMLANAALKRRNEQPANTSILSPRKEDLHQPPEVVEENVEVREEQDTEMQQERAIPRKISEKPESSGATRDDFQDQKLIQREQEMRKMLDNFFNKQKQIMSQKGIESPEGIFTTPAQDSIPKSKDVPNDVAQQDWNEITKHRQLHANAALQRRRELLAKLSALSSAIEDPAKLSEISEDNAKRRDQEAMNQKESVTFEEILETPADVTASQFDTQNQELRKQELRKILASYYGNQNKKGEQDEVNQKEIATPKKVLKTPTETGAAQSDAQNQELMLRKQELKKILANYYSNQNGAKEQEGVNEKEIATSNKVSKTQTEATQNQELMNYNNQNQINGVEREIHQENIRSIHNLVEIGPQKQQEARSSGELEGNRNGHPQDLGGTLTKCLQEFQRTREATLRRPETEEDSKLEKGALDTKPECPQSSKIYVTLHRREPDNIPTLQKPGHHSSGPPRGSDDASVRPKPIKDYVTLPSPAPNSLSTKTKDYVTLRPRISNEASRLEISKGESLRSKGYVTKRPIKQSAPPAPPPTHIFWPVKRYPSNPGPSTPKPPRTLQESEESPPGVRQLKEEIKTAPSIPFKPRSRQARIFQHPRLSPVPEEEALPLMTFEESNETCVQRGRKILETLMTPFSTGIQDVVQRFFGRHISVERQASVKKLRKGCVILFYSLLIGGVIAASLYLAKAFLTKESDIKSFNATSPFDSGRNLSIPVTQVINKRQIESLNNSNFDPFANDSSAHLTFSSLDSEIPPKMNGSKDNVNMPDVNTESSVATLGTNLDATVIIFGFGVAVPVNDFDLNITTPVAAMDII